MAPTLNNGATTQCSMVDRVGVGLDLGLLLIKTGTRGHCDTTNSASGTR
jgi:hypothetical protein